MRSVIVRSCLALSALLLVPSVASADGLFTVFIGSTTFGSGAYASSSKSAITFGGNVSFMRTAGVEIDWGYSNHVTGADDVSNDNARTLMVNFIANVGPQASRVRPYVSGGGGLMALRVGALSDLFKANSTVNDFGINVGGGVRVAASGPVSVKVDLRYFRDLEDFPPHSKVKVGFFRVTGGVALGF